MHTSHKKRALCIFWPLNAYDTSVIMEEKIIERRIQLRGSSFVLTIPQDIAKKMSIRAGQSIRFQIVKDGECMIRPTNVNTIDSVDSTEHDTYEKAVENMMNNSTKSKNPTEVDTTPKRDRLEKLKLK